MVASQFIDFFTKYNYANRVAVEDFSDRLSIFTVVLFLLSCFIVSAKQYFYNSISCYIPVKPTGDNYNNYLIDYCWVHGTIPLRPDEAMPNSVEEWNQYDEHRRITYYQWIPFILGLQCIFFYLPHLIWQTLSAHRSGGDLFALIKTASEAATLSRKGREGAISRVTEFLEDMIGCHQQCRKGRRAKIAKVTFGVLGVFSNSKRLGTHLIFSYMFVKLITLINAIFQIYLIQYFLGFQKYGSAGELSMQLGQDYSIATIPSDDQYVYGFTFGLQLIQHILSGRDWPETLLFPRVAYCRVPGVRIVGGKNAYTAQCTLPINMLNEKIYIFLWFWIVFVVLMTAVSFMLWLIRMIVGPKRKDFIKRYLRTKSIQSVDGEEIQRHDLDDFVDQYLRRDGVFLIRMLSINAGDVITSEIVVQLFCHYVEKHVANPTAPSEKQPSLV